MRKWKPSASQRRAFAERMKDPEEKKLYEQRKIAHSEKRRSKSKFDYNSAGGNYVPTKEQRDFCMNNMHLFSVGEQEAANMVIFGYDNQEKVDHDMIHVVNEKRRSAK